MADAPRTDSDTTTAAPAREAGSRHEEPAGRAKATAPAGLSSREKLQINLTRNGLYHEDRERFYDGVQRWTMFLVVVAGSAAVFNLAAMNVAVASIVAAATTALGLVDLVFNVSGKARIHGELRLLSFTLLGELDAGGDEVSINSRLIASYGKEPVSNGTVGALAYNNAMNAYGRPVAATFYISPQRRFWRHFLPDASDLVEIRELPAGHPARPKAL
ncbi:hypothetical protein OSH11_13760 [Kaistia dalseonensis]|uniref:DUF304 domain-containing protein n=1 Tax=Kaistia dalseonensis TaxID=410840 RepID=A0ABU0H7X8_9HYPH|nr:hypothetical protein [Kaistia dalseonensis]MCX5495775.1 hypothetical protein [Kaistia dalseonensis]MDQ0438375.1 hypothetical protein [Kaistia dalseonensis]